MFKENLKLKISFGIIVLNGEPFVRPCILSLYPFAYEIIVVEGGSRNAVDQAPHGHSIDETLKTLKTLKEHEDPEDKIRIITRDGFWEEKDEQSRAYAQYATGDYLWQVDIDEFYHEDDMHKIINLLSSRPEITAMAFSARYFWGGFNYISETGLFFYSGRNEFRRIFKWGKGYSYKTHRPPTVIDNNGRNLWDIKHVGKEETARAGIFMYHYHQVFPSQVKRKSHYYMKIGWKKTKNIVQWAEINWKTLKYPFHIWHTSEYHLSWLKKFEGTHPEQIESLIEDLRDGRIDIATRHTEDIDELLNSKWYLIRRDAVRLFEFIRAMLMDNIILKPGKMIVRFISRIIHEFRSETHE